MADNHSTFTPSYEAGRDRDHETSGGSSLQMKRNRWGTTPFPIPTATMSLDEESTLQASKSQVNTPSSILSPSGQAPTDSGGKYFVRKIRKKHIIYKFSPVFVNKC